MKLFSIRLLAVGLLLSMPMAFANEFQPEDGVFDPAPKAAHPVRRFESPDFFEALRLDSILPVKNDLKRLIGLQTPVKSQGRRGTCSMFSATGTLESLIKIEKNEALDLAENYIEYTVITHMQAVPTEGSDTPTNVPALARYGTILEDTWKYEEYDWTKADLPVSELARAQATCGAFRGHKKTRCLLTHMSPDNDKYQDEALDFRKEYGTSRLRYKVLGSLQAIKQRLSQNMPVILSIEVFYGAWNHRLMVDVGIGPRNMVNWEKGIVSNPTPDDIRLSRKQGAGHSIVLVGYDDEGEVYYFKNSWGTNGFGARSDLLGSGTTAGYGTIAYDYANEHGTFYDVRLAGE